MSDIKALREAVATTKLPPYMAVGESPRDTLARLKQIEQARGLLVHFAPALLDELEALRKEREALVHGEALLEARTRRGITDCSTPIYMRVQNIVEQLEKAEADLALARADVEAALRFGVADCYETVQLFEPYSGRVKELQDAAWQRWQEGQR